MQYTNQAVMKIWGIITECVETNKIIHGVEFAKKWKVLEMYLGELVCYFFSRIDSLCAKKRTKCQKEVTEDVIFALVIASSPKIFLSKK